MESAQTTQTFKMFLTEISVPVNQAVNVRATCMYSTTRLTFSLLILFHPEKWQSHQIVAKDPKLGLIPSQEG